MNYKHKSSKLNTSKYRYVSLTVQLKHQSFVYKQLNDQTVLFQTIQFSISHLFTYSLNVKQFYLTNRFDPIRCYHSGPEWTWEHWQWKGTLHFLKVQHYWSLTIRWFYVKILDTCYGEACTRPSAEIQSVYSTAPADWAIEIIELYANKWLILKLLVFDGGAGSHFTLCRLVIFISIICLPTVG